MANDAKAQDQADERQGMSEQAQQDLAEGEAASAKVEALEDDPPQDLADWPDDKAKYKTLAVTRCTTTARPRSSVPPPASP